MKVGMIGLGAMGVGMADNLAKAGLLHAVWNRTESKAAAFVAGHAGVTVLPLEAMGAACDTVVVCVSADQDMLDVVRALLDSSAALDLVIDCSTVSREAAWQAAKLCAEEGVDFIDAPVSGGCEGARNGTLAIMAGGADAHIAKAAPVFDAIGSKVAHMGPVGAGQATKAVNQIIAAGINQAVSEGLAFAEAMDLPVDQVVDVVSAGAAGNWFLQHRGKTMSREVYEPGFKLALHLKDLRICAAMAKSAGNGAELQVIEQTIADYEALLEQHGEDDISSLIAAKRGLFSV